MVDPFQNMMEVMMGRLAGLVGVLAVTMSLAHPTPVEAQDEWVVEEDAPQETKAPPPPGKADAPSSPPVEATHAEATEPPREPMDEDVTPAGPRKWYIGPWFRYLFVPSFALELFLDEAPTVAGPGFGASATFRDDDVHWVMGLGYTSYAFEDPFREKGALKIHTEWVDSSLGILHLTGSILWQDPLSKAFTFEYGVGADLGIVWGELRRTEAYPYGDGRWAPCVGVGNPDPIYCERGSVAYDEYGAHYDVEEKRVPPVALLPMVPHLALRWNPADHWAVKLEGSYGILQVWLGLSVAYAPNFD